MEKETAIRSGKKNFRGLAKLVGGCIDFSIVSYGLPRMGEMKNSLRCIYGRVSNRIFKRRKDEGDYSSKNIY